MSKLKVRVISGVVGAAIVLAMIFSTPAVFHLLIAAACFVMMHELRTTYQQEKKWQLVVLNSLFATVILVSPVLPMTWQLFLLSFLLVAYLMLLLMCAVIWHETISFADVISSFFILIYAVLLPMHVSYIRMMNLGRELVILALLGAWMPDTFAYFIGCAFGRHKLIPGVSPNKTVEGSCGAVLGAVVTFLAYGLIMDFGLGYQVSYVALLVLAVLCGIVAQFGDLAASVIKRSYGVKDFGNLIPGHGGVVDRVDSLLFVAPLVYYFLLVFEVVCK
ncbi:MAG: phosphatidate cytidylyltransferase [Ruminococcaceae bacterium]|nr:phosphatidate cytidylyltransferase [Oscillospiraceae bacterium]